MFSPLICRPGLALGRLDTVPEMTDFHRLGPLFSVSSAASLWPGNKPLFTFTGCGTRAREKQHDEALGFFLRLFISRGDHRSNVMDFSCLSLKNEGYTVKSWLIVISRGWFKMKVVVPESGGLGVIAL